MSIIIVTNKIYRGLKFILPEFLVVLIIIICAVFLSGFWHKFDYGSRYLFFLNKGFRIDDVQLVYAGLESTGQPLLSRYEYTDSLGATGNGYYQAEALGDDLGIYYFLPLMMKYLKISAGAAYNIFFICVVLAGFFIGIIGLKLLYRDRLTKIVSIIYLSLYTFFCLYILDVYVWIYLLISLLPLYLWTVKESIK